MCRRLVCPKNFQDSLQWVYLYVRTSTRRSNGAGATLPIFQLFIQRTAHLFFQIYAFYVDKIEEQIDICLMFCFLLRNFGAVIRLLRSNKWPQHTTVQLCYRPHKD